VTKRSLFIVFGIWLAGSAACRDKEQPAAKATTVSKQAPASERAPDSQRALPDQRPDDAELVQDIK
jgi:hypothetical protein